MTSIAIVENMARSFSATAREDLPKHRGARRGSVASTVEHGDLPFDGIAAEAHGDTVGCGLASRKLREDGNAEAGSDE
jgi:hypothetical protein